MSEKVEVTLGEAELARAGIAKLDADKLPVKAAYWLGVLKDKLTTVLKPADEQKKVLLEKYGTDKGGGNFVIQPENRKAFLDEMTPLYDEKVELDVKKLRLSQFLDKDVTTGGVVALKPFLNDDTDD